MPLFDPKNELVQLCNEIKYLLKLRPELLPQAVEELIFLVKFQGPSLDYEKAGHDGWAQLHEESMERLGIWLDKMRTA